MPNPKDIIDPTTTMNMALVLMAKAFKLNYSTPTNNNQRISSNPHNRQITQPSMNLGQDRQMQMVVSNAVQNLGVQNVGNQNALIDVSLCSLSSLGRAMVVLGISTAYPKTELGSSYLIESKNSSIRHIEQCKIQRIRDFLE
ncbi:hypothetical protein Tco_0664850 [Tanacetum coccineum]